MANVTPKAILYKGQIVRFSNKELRIITTKAAYLGITPYESAKIYASNMGIATTPTQPTPVQPKPTQTKTATVQLIGTGQQGKLLYADSHGAEIETKGGSVRWFHISEYTYHLD